MKWPRYTRISEGAGNPMARTHQSPPRGWDRDEALPCMDIHITRIDSLLDRAKETMIVVNAEMEC